MKDLVVAAYGGSLQALQTLDGITALNYSWLPHLSSALVVTRDAEGRLDVQGAYPPAEQQGPEGPVFWGVALGGLLLAPFTGGVSGGAAGTNVAAAAGAAALTHLATERGPFFIPQDIGLPLDFVKRASESVQLGYSAIIALVESREPDEVAAFLRATGAVVNRITLTPEQLDRAQLRTSSEKLPSGR